MHSRSYLATALVTLFLLSLGCIGLTVLVDPYRMFGTRAIAGLNVLKPRVYEHADLAKTYLIERVRPRTILLGNSRTEIGFDPQSKVWPATWQPVFNAALSGRSLFVALRMLQEAIAAAPVKRAILQVDFPDFLTAPTANGTVRLADEEGRLLVTRSGTANPGRNINVWRDRIEATLTIDALTDSLRTIWSQHSAAVETMTRFGFNPLSQYLADVKLIGYYGIFAQKRSVYEAVYRNYPHPDFAEPMNYAPFRDLVQITKTAQAHGVELIIFIPPYHAELLDIMHEVGLWPSFEDWKRALIKVAGKGCPQADQAHCSIPVIDFSGYNQYTSETVPAKGDTHSQTKWYWEPGHYKASLGDVMLPCLISGVCAFGKALTESPVAQISTRKTPQPAASDDAD